MRVALVASACLTVAACAPSPRAENYFEAHPDEAAKVVQACAQGVHRGDECQNASAALARLKGEERMKFYRRGF